MSKDIYLICPVRRCSALTKSQLDRYVAIIEQTGMTVHYPHRDVPQGTQEAPADGTDICERHIRELIQAKEVHVWYTLDGKSEGTFFDLGMAYMLQYVLAVYGRKLKFVIANPGDIPNEINPDSYIKLLIDLQAGR